MIFEQVEIIDAGAEGMAVGRIGEKIVFVPFVVPGDIVDVQVTRKKKRYLEGKAVRFHRYSEKRTEPHCRHFGLCGGCRWQGMKYEEQLHYKQKQVTDSLVRIGKLTDPVVHPILPSADTRYYRNKLDFTFSVHRWLTDGDRREGDSRADTRAVGFHVPQFFDKVVDIDECFHMKEPANAIRNEARRYAIEKGLEFYDVRTWKGFLRNLILRNTEAGGLMVILVVRQDTPALYEMLDHLAASFPEITSLYYVINTKQNDSLYDLDFKLHKGDAYLTERMPCFLPGGKEIEFRIGPLSFFQTNSRQAVNLYRIAAEQAAFSGHETVYDLYTGTGTIACYVAPMAGRVIGIESVPQAVEDARVNACINGFENIRFYPGEAEKVLTPDFIRDHGHPDVLITDPPRNGMHEKVVKTILETAPERIVYVSCNPATQARDIGWLSSRYILTGSRPVDMFPHTHHVENIATLILRDP